VDCEAGLVRTEPEGELTTREVLDYFSQIAVDPNLPEDAIDIVDFSGVTDFVFRYTSARQIAQSYSSLVQGGQIVATIFVGGTELAFGMARMLRGILELQCSEHPIRVIRSMAGLDAIVTDLRSNPRVQTDTVVEGDGKVGADQ
jgi:hypothetical protein